MKISMVGKEPIFPEESIDFGLHVEGHDVSMQYYNQIEYLEIYLWYSGGFKQYRYDRKTNHITKI